MATEGCKRRTVSGLASKAGNCMAIQSKQSPQMGGGGQFERMVGLVKQALYKTTGKANLSWKELEEVLLDIETTLNNRPLSLWKTTFRCQS